mmetsp:Transcript_4286/g.5023  ORF Transcript_4286/g.5023 Transcript_4286/m.5023 type:complete len:80 (-) Transcript_4286:543-782(-)
MDLCDGMLPVIFRKDEWSNLSTVCKLLSAAVRMLTRSRLSMNIWIGLQVNKLFWSISLKSGLVQIKAKSIIVFSLSARV